MMTPERLGELREEAKFECVSCAKKYYMSELLGQIDYLCDAFLDMEVVRQNTFQNLLKTEKERDELKAELNASVKQLSENYQKLHHEYCELAVENQKLRERIAALREGLRQAKIFSACEDEIESTVNDALAADDEAEKGEE